MSKGIMTIKSIMVGLLALLSVQLILSQGLLFHQAYNDSIRSSKAAAANIVVSDLLKAGALRALERGLTNTALNDPEPASSDTTKKITDIRAESAKYYSEAMDSMGATSLTIDKKYQENISAASEEVKSLRQLVDQDLSKPKTSRDADVVTKWVPTITNLIMGVQKLRINLSSQSLVGDAALGKDTLIRHSIWMMTEYAGRERAMLGGIIASATSPISQEQLEKLAGFRSKVDEGWSILTNINMSPEEHAAFDAALDAAKTDFFGDFEKVRQNVYAEGKASFIYSISAKDWVARSTQAIDTLLKLQEISTTWIANLMDNNKASAQRNIALNGMSLAVAIAAVICAIWVVLARVIKPINAMSSSMNVIATGEYNQLVPYMERIDEIGHMAKSVEVFRQNGLEKLQLEAQAKEAELRAQEEKRKAQNDLASKFEFQVQGIISTVASAATQLYQTAEGMSKTIAISSTKAELVANASGQASQNVQSVAAAAEEMTATVKEIASQLAKSSMAVKETVLEVNRADGIAALLAEATKKIGQIIEVIQNIAGQINLLALNATIEAARAGEAGKGFSVVASEVKNLANQTSKSTEEITGHVQSIQDVSRQVIEVLQSVKKSVSSVDEYAAAISAAVEEQSATNNEISSNMSRAATGTRQINDDISEVSKASAEASDAAAQTLEAARMVSKEAEKLNQEVSAFLAGVRNG